MSAQHRKRLGLAAKLVALGLLVQLASAIHWTPLTFVLASLLGLGPVLLGAVVFLHTVWQIVEPGERP